MIRELVVGLLMTEGIIRGEWCADRMSIEYGEDVVVNIQAADAVISKEGGLHQAVWGHNICQKA